MTIAETAAAIAANMSGARWLEGVDSRVFANHPYSPELARLLSVHLTNPPFEIYPAPDLIDPSRPPLLGIRHTQ